MAVIKWIKITTDMFDDEKIKLIDAMPERDTIHYIWIRLLVQAGKINFNGYIFLNENIPYTDEMLATVFNRPLNSVRLALEVLANFEMIYIQEDKLIKIKNWAKYQNIDGMERIREQNKIRKQKQRAKEKGLIPEPCPDNELSHDMSRDITEQNKNEESDEEKEIEIDEGITTSGSIEISNAQIFKQYEKCNFILSPMLIEKLSADIEIYGAGEVLKAAEIADANGIHNYSYAKGVMERRRANHNNGNSKNNTGSSDRNGIGITL